MDQFLSLQFLGTFAGVVLATNVVVQVIKDLPGLQRMPTRWVVLIVSEGILFALATVQHTLSAQGVLLNFLNGFVVAAAAMSSWQVAKDNGVLAR
ncbi:MAG: hypothetical protein ACYC9Q_08010 [Bacillota bacterium]